MSEGGGLPAPGEARETASPVIRAIFSITTSVLGDSSRLFVTIAGDRAAWRKNSLSVKMSGGRNIATISSRARQLALLRGNSDERSDVNDALFTAIRRGSPVTGRII